MVTYKTEAEIAVLRQAGGLLARILEELAQAALPGVATLTLDTLARRRITEAGAKPAFLGYRSGDAGPEFPRTLCTSINEQVVHGIPSRRTLQAGDIVALDLGLAMKLGERWLYVDAAKTVAVGTVSRTARRLLQVAEEALAAGIAEITPGRELVEVSRAIQRRVEAAGYSVVRQLVGHGVGYAVHEEPKVPNFVDPRNPRLTLQPGLVIAVEPMVNAGRPDVTALEDGWTIATADGSLSAHFEHTVAVTAAGHQVLTLP